MDMTAASVDELFTLARASEDEDAYWACVSELHTRADERTFKLAEVLCDSFAVGERCLGADVLGQLGAGPDRSAAEGPFAQRSADVLLRLLEEDDEPSVLSSAAVGLGHLRDERGLDRLAGLAGHASADVRRGVVHGLMGHDDDRAVAALIKLTTDLDDWARDWATFALAVQIDRDTPEVREALAARIEDPDPDARDEALLGLARRGDPRALEPALAAAPLLDASRPSLEEALVVLGADGADARLQPYLEELSADAEKRRYYGKLLEQALARF
jgi:hypothetical protein